MPKRPHAPRRSRQRSRRARSRSAPSSTAHTDDPVAATLTHQPGPVPVNDDQNTLKAGDRGPSLLEDFHFREKITHFDHERIPERVVHARGSAAHGVFQVYESLATYTKAGFLTDPARRDAGLRPLLDRGRLARLDGPRARRARLRREVLHGRGQLRPRRQQHAGLLHPGRDQVPGPHPRREAGAAQRDPAGAVGARHVLGLHLADARVDAHGHVADVRPGDPAQLPDDGGLRRPHLPAGQRDRDARAS